MTRRAPPGSPSGAEPAEPPREESQPSAATSRLDPDPVERSLGDLIGFADQASRSVARGRANLDDDEFQRLAAEAILHRIGEAVARLDARAPDLVAAHPEISWRRMKGMRHVVAHEYGAIDYDIFWNALADDLPSEAEAVRRVLDEYVASV